MIHIMGEAYADKSVNPLIVSAVFIAALMVFMLIERLMESLGITHTHWIDGEEDHPHKHEDSHEHEEVEEKKELADKDAKDKVDKGKSSKHSKSSKAVNIQKSTSHSAANKSSNNTESLKKPESEKEGVSAPSSLDSWMGKGSAGYMNLLASLIHNFMDGLTIGLGFATGNQRVYAPIVIGIFVHEIPR